MIIQVPFTNSIYNRGLAAGSVSTTELFCLVFVIKVVFVMLVRMMEKEHKDFCNVLEITVTQSFNAEKINVLLGFMPILVLFFHPHIAIVYCE